MKKHDKIQHAPNMNGWMTLCSRVNDPKLAYIEAELTTLKIEHRRHGQSWHGPVLQVKAKCLDQARLSVNSLDGKDDNNPMFKAPQA